MPQSNAARSAPADPERELLQAFGKRLARLRVERGLSQKAIGDQLGIRDELVSKYERGLHYPKLATLVRLRSVLSISLDHLLAGAPVGKIGDPLLLDAALAVMDLPVEQRAFLAFALQGLAGAIRRSPKAQRALAGGK